MALRASLSPESSVSVSSSLHSVLQRIDLAPKIGVDIFAFARQIKICGDVFGPARRSVSVANMSSRRFFSRITCWDLAGFDHRFGSEACFSISASCGRSLPASKVLP